MAVNPAMKRKAATSSAVTPTNATAPATSSGPQTPVVAPQPATQTAGTPVLPSADVWKNPYSSSFSAIPLASPPSNPDLTPQDLTSQMQEYSDWDRYLNSIGLTAANLAATTATQVGGIERNQAQGLENNNWDTAARGLAASSIRDTNATDINTSAAAAKGGLITQLDNAQRHYGNEKNRWEGVGGMKEGIDAKYLGVAATNRANRAAAATPAPAATAPAQPTPAAAPLPTIPGMTPAQVAQAVQQLGSPTVMSDMPGAQKNGGIYMQGVGVRSGLRYQLKDGVRFYESKAGAGDWGKGGKIKP